MRATALLLVVAPLLAMAQPAMAQDVTATLRIHGNVMISAGGEFVTATDRQPVLAGQRILLGDDASATVEYDRDCRRTFDTVGVHMIQPGRCDDDRDDDRSDEQSREQPKDASGQTVASGSGPWTTLTVALGSAAVGAALMEQREESPPDHPISR